MYRLGSGAGGYGDRAAICRCHGAHAAYSYFEGAGSAYRGVGLGEETSQSGDRYLFRSGASLVEATGGHGAKVEELLNRIQVGLPKVSGPKGVAPTPRRRCYLRRDWNEAR